MRKISYWTLGENKPKQSQSQAPTPKGAARRYAGKLSVALGSAAEWILCLMDRILCQNRLRIHSTRRNLVEKHGRTLSNKRIMKGWKQ